MGVLAGASTTSAAFDATDIRWAPGYRHPTTHPTINSASPVPYPAIYLLSNAANNSGCIWTPNTVSAKEPQGFVATQVALPSPTQGFSTSLANGVATLCFGSPMADPVWDGTSSASKQQTDTHSNRTLPNVPCFAPSTIAAVSSGKWEYSGTLWADTNKQAGNATYGFELAVLSYPSQAQGTYVSVMGTGNVATVSYTVSASNVIDNNPAAANVSLVGATAYPFLISKISGGTSSNIRVTFGTGAAAIDKTIVTTAQFNDHITLSFVNYANVGSAPYRVLNARFRQL